MVNCKTCGADFETRQKFHRHLKKCTGLSTKEYYEREEPKIDPYDLSLIPFKTYKQYRKTFFNSKENCIHWFKQNAGLEKAANLLKEMFEARIEIGEFKKTPTQAELRSLKSPSILGIEKVTGENYDSFCQKLGLEPRVDDREFELEPEVDIVTDTREQHPLFEYKREKIEVGDYTSINHFSGVCIERKSLEDFIGTFTRKENFERFEKELQRAEGLGIYLVTLCEQDIETVMEWSNPHSGGRSNGYAAISKMREFLQAYDCQFVFTNKGRNERALLENILKMKEGAKRNDLQLLHDLKRI